MKEIELHQEGLRFVRSVLQGGDHLAQAMLRTLPLEEGRVFTFLPDEVDPDLISLEQGGLSQFDYDDDLKAPLIGLISGFLQSFPDNMAVIEATSLLPQQLLGWAAHVPAGSRYFTTESTARKSSDVGMIGVYGFMGAGQADAASLDDFIDEAFPFRQVGALTSVPEGKPPKPGEQ